MSEQPANWATSLDAAAAAAAAEIIAKDNYSDAEESQYEVYKNYQSMPQTQATLTWARGMAYAQGIPLADSITQTGAAIAWGNGMFPQIKPTGGNGSGGGNDRDPNVPEQPATASVAPGSEDIKRLSMPGLDEAISKEIERLTLELINDTKEVLNTGINYKSIDFLPSKEVYASRPKPVSTIKYEFTKMVTKFENTITNLKNNDYVNYLNLFSVVYNDSGAAELTFNMEIPEYYSSEIELGQVKIVNRGGVK